MTDSLSEKYTRRIGGTLLTAAVVTLAFGGIFAAHVAQTPGSGVGAVLALSLVVVINIGLVTIVVGGNVGLELKRLITAARRMQAGDLENTTVVSDRRDELGELANAFTEMGDSLQTAFDDSDAARAEAEAAQAAAEQFNREVLDHATDVAKSMRAVADGRLDETAPTGTDIDAIDAIGSAYEEMTVDLSETVVEIRAFADRVDEVSTSVRADSATVEREQQQFAADLRNYAEAIVEQAEELETVTADVSQLSAAIEEIASTSDTVADQATRAAQLSDEGTTQAQETVGVIEELSEIVANLADTVDALDTSMGDVAESTAIIESISEQTNLLALNANIEAARSGTEGDGFAVVADEVKTLAAETQQQSDDIALVIEQTHSDVDDVLAEMRAAESKIDASVGSATASGTTFQKLDSSASEVEGSVGEVARATEDSAARTEQVTATVDEVATHARRVAKQGQEIAAAAEENAETVGAMRARAEALTGATTELKRELNRFTVVDSVRTQAERPSTSHRVEGETGGVVATDGGSR